MYASNISMLELAAAHALLEMQIAARAYHNATGLPTQIEKSPVRENNPPMYLGHPKGIQVPITRVQGGLVFSPNTPRPQDIAGPSKSPPILEISPATPPQNSPTKGNTRQEIAIQTDRDQEMQKRDATIAALNNKIKELEEKLKTLKIRRENLNVVAESDADSSDTTSNGDGSVSNLDTTNEADLSSRRPLMPIDANVSGMVAIGEGYARVPARLYNTISWVSHTYATRKLLSALFPRKVLATHSMTGKQSPAFPDKPAKKQLDPNIVSDIVLEVTERCKVEAALVRNSITTKLADESKMYKTRQRNKKIHRA